MLSTKLSTAFFKKLIFPLIEPLRGRTGVRVVDRPALIREKVSLLGCESTKHPARAAARDRRRERRSGSYQKKLSPCAPLRVSGAELKGLCFATPATLSCSIARPHRIPRTWYHLCPTSCAGPRLFPRLAPRSQDLRPALVTLRRTAHSAVYSLGLSNWPVPPSKARREYKRIFFAVNPEPGPMLLF